MMAAQLLAAPVYGASQRSKQCDAARQVISSFQLIVLLPDTGAQAHSRHAQSTGTMRLSSTPPIRMWQRNRGNDC